MSSTGDWDICGDRFYEKVELYHLEWEALRLIDTRYRAVLSDTGQLRLLLCSID